MAVTTNRLDDITYDGLYERWERGNWRATDIDFTVDAAQWTERFSELERRAALWNYAMFLHGEDAVADNLSPYIDAAPLEEQKYFLATQQVDEARHSVFFGRFMREVVGCGDSHARTLAQTQSELTWGFRQVFARLDRMADELRRDPSPPQLAAAITLYHLVIEANLAQPGQHFITRYLDESRLMPGFREGMAHVAHDEQRHIAFGVKLLSELVAQDPECRAAAIELLGEVLPAAVAVFVPPNWDARYTECFGFGLEEIYTEGTRSLWTKLRTVGFTDAEIAGITRTDPSLTHEEAARRALLLVRAGVLGEGLRPPAPTPEVVAAFFDGMRFAIDHRRSPSHPVTIQWDLSDAEPWLLRIADGSASVEQRRAERPDLTMSCRFRDIVDIAAGREDPRRAIATRRLRPKGNLRLLWRTQRLFT